MCCYVGQVHTVCRGFISDKRSSNLYVLELLKATFIEERFDWTKEANKSMEVNSNEIKYKLFSFWRFLDTKAITFNLTKSDKMTANGWKFRISEHFKQGPLKLFWCSFTLYVRAGMDFQIPPHFGGVQIFFGTPPLVYNTPEKHQTWQLTTIFTRHNWHSNL